NRACSAGAAPPEKTARMTSRCQKSMLLLMSGWSPFIRTARAWLPCCCCRSSQSCLTFFCSSLTGPSRSRGTTAPHVHNHEEQRREDFCERHRNPCYDRDKQQLLRWHRHQSAEPQEYGFADHQPRW